MIRNNQAAVSTIAAPIFTVPVTGNCVLIIKNLKTSSQTVWIGDENVTPSNGFPLDPGESFSTDLTVAEKVYGVTASSTATVAILRQRV